MMFNPNKPFNVPTLPPKGITSAVLQKATSKARRAIDAFKLEGFPPGDLSRFIALEAESSFAIEGISLASDKVYRQALLSSIEVIRQRPITFNLACSICSKLTGVDMDVRKQSGTKLRNVSTGTVIYTPPIGERNLRDKLSNWELFINETDIDPLIAMAVAHYQFEAIHPFFDGNGRTGRILNQLLLIDRGVIETPFLPMSCLLEKNKEHYYRCLLNVSRNDDWESYLLFMLNVVSDTCLMLSQRL